MNDDHIRARLSHWYEGPTKDALVAFLADSGSVPPTHRIAAFDNDGTLQCEKPHKVLTEFLTHGPAGPSTPDRGIRGALTRFGARSTPRLIRPLAGVTARVTVQQYDLWARQFLSTATHPRFGTHYPDLVYAPMVQLIHVMHELGFTVLIASAGSRDLLRAYCLDTYDVPPVNVVGSEVRIIYRNGQLLRTRQPIDVGYGGGKAAHLWDQCGHMPAFAAGNTAGDLQMLHEATFALVIDHDDPDREYAYHDQKILTAATTHGWTTASMRNDFAHMFTHPTS